MRLLKHELLWIGVTYFLILLGIALCVRDIPDQFDSFTTIQQVIEESEFGDPTSFATAAIDIAENNWISGHNDWIFNLWPPGFILLETAIIKMLGPDAPLILILQILAAIIFSFVLVLLNGLLRSFFNTKIVAYTLPLLVFAFPVSRVFLLQPTGIALGESFSIGFFLLSILLTFRSVLKNSLHYGAYAGLFLALSAYFRSQFEILLLALTGSGILLIIALLLTRLRKSIEPKLIKPVVETIAVVIFIAHAATFPWRAYHWIYQGSPAWVYTSALTFKNSVMTSNYLESIQGGWVVAGGGNLVCRIDPTTCGDTTNAKKLFVKTFITHPFNWYSLKFDVIGKYWFSSLRNWGGIKFEATSVDIATNGLLLMSLILLVALLFTRKVRSHNSWVLLMWFNASLFSAYMLIFTVVQFEVRYFYFPKIAGIFMFLIVTCLHYQPVKTQIHIEKD